jgi:hypothetical protein
MYVYGVHTQKLLCRVALRLQWVVVGWMLDTFCASAAERDNPVELCAAKITRASFICAPRKYDEMEEKTARTPFAPCGCAQIRKLMFLLVQCSIKCYFHYILIRTMRINNQTKIYFSQSNCIMLKICIVVVVQN